MSALYRNSIRFFRVIGTIFILQIMGGMLPAHAADPGTTAPLPTVYKDANCGCCEKWLTHNSHNWHRYKQ